MRQAVERSFNRLSELVSTSLSHHELSKLEQAYRDKYSASILDNTWVKIFRGRDILSRFVSKKGLQLTYQVFRNLLLDRMRADGVQPPGMKSIIERILAH